MGIPATQIKLINLVSNKNANKINGNQTNSTTETTEYNKTQTLTPEETCSKLEKEISEAQQQLKSKLDYLVKIMEQLGEPTFTEITQVSENQAKMTNGNPHLDGFRELLNEPMAEKGSITPEEGAKKLQDYLGKLQQALMDIDNDINEATIRLQNQQNTNDKSTNTNKYKTSIKNYSAVNLYQSRNIAQSNNEVCKTYKIS